MSLLDRALVRVLPTVPRPVVQRISARYIAGPELADACTVVRALNEAGKAATVDVLGEEVASRGEALALVEEYRRVLSAIEAEGLDANVSVKPTGLGLKLDRRFFRENLQLLVRSAAERGNFVRVDMEDASTTDDTLAAYRELRAEGHDVVGVVLQARLKRTHADVRELADLTPNVRMCKGIYLEVPEIAYQEPETIRESFVEAVEELLDLGAYVAVATHDEWVVEESLRICAERGLEREEYEFQMLLGVREGLADGLVRAGHRVRIYVPYGRQWYEYSLRRLQENPRIAGYVAADTLGRLLPGRNHR